MKIFLLTGTIMIIVTLFLYQGCTGKTKTAEEPSADTVSGEEQEKNKELPFGKAPEQKKGPYNSMVSNLIGFDSVTYAIEKQAAEVPAGSFRLSCFVYWKEGEETEETGAGIGYFALCPRGSTEWVEPVESYTDTSSAYKTGTFDLEMRPNISGNGFEGFWLRGIEFLDGSGMEYLVKMNLNGSLINFKNASYYSVYPEGFKKYLERNNLIDDIPEGYFIGGATGGDTYVAVPAGSFDVRIHKDGDEEPVWLEGYTPEPGRINVVDYDNLPQGYF
jgi:hypothetical protein